MSQQDQPGDRGDDAPRGQREELDVDQVEQAISRYAESLRDNDLPNTEDFLNALPPEKRADAILELLSVEISHRRRLDEPLDFDALAQRYDVSKEVVEKTAGRWAHDASTTRQTPNPLQRLGRYEITGLLGEGGFGCVYKALDTRLQRWVALKVPSESTAQAADVNALVEEARAAAALRHAHIVAVYDVQVDGQTPYIVQELVDGWDLGQWLQHEKPSLTEVVARLIEVAKGLQHAHSQRFVHRDLKPSNVLVSRDGTAFVADFGLALHESRQHGFGGDTSGTPAYMSPEQVRGETHRLDGRADIWSFGVILYECLTGSRPFRGQGVELFESIVSADPRPPRQLRSELPRELQRICLRCLAKRRSDRFSSASELSEDLEAWLDSNASQPLQPLSDIRPPEVPSSTGSIETSESIVPRGLREFEGQDADFFASLLPGARDRFGVPDILRDWVDRLRRPQDAPFCVGLIYGPSGSGKSSFIRAGLIPRLGEDVITVYLACDGKSNVVNLRNAILRRVGAVHEQANLAQLLIQIRSSGLPGDGKLLIVLDQFEQVLHAAAHGERRELVNALRQCDGRTVQCLLAARDDFWMPLTEFFAEIEVDLVQSENMGAVGLWGPRHARRVLRAFGRAYGALDDEITAEQDEFLDAAVQGLQQDGKIVCVHLAMFAEMFKDREWNLDTLQNVGGTRGVGVAYLREIFGDKSPSPDLYRHRTAARAVLQALLPSVASDIKGNQRSLEDLREAADYSDREADFEKLLRLLDADLRLITPVDAETRDDVERMNSSKQTGGSETPPSNVRYYRLTHDYLVPSLREWFFETQMETRRGRALLKMAERCETWQATRDHRYLPSWWEWVTWSYWSRGRHERTSEQAEMMRVAGRRFSLLGIVSAVILASFILLGLHLRRTAIDDQRRAESARLVEGLLRAETAQVSDFISALQDYGSPTTDAQLRAIVERPPGNLPNARLHASLALLPTDDRVLVGLRDDLLTVSPRQFRHVCRQMSRHATQLSDHYRRLALDKDLRLESRFRAACALAAFSSDDSFWDDQANCASVATRLVNSQPSSYLEWRRLLRPVGGRLVGQLQRVYRSDDATESERRMAADALNDFLRGESEQLVDLMLDADARTFPIFLGALQERREFTIKQLTQEVQRRLTARWPETPVDFADLSVSANVAIELAGGIVDERYAMCQHMSWNALLELMPDMKNAGYRPIRVRPFVDTRTEPPQLRTAAIWWRDGGEFEFQQYDTKSPPPTNGIREGDRRLAAIDIAFVPRSNRTDLSWIVLWAEATGGEDQRQMVTSATRQQILELDAKFRSEGLHSQVAISQTSGSGEPVYAGIWSDVGATSQLRVQYDGEELLTRPQLDIAISGDEFAGVWGNTVAWESRVLSIPAEQFVARTMQLGTDGFRPVALAVRPRGGSSELQSTVVFHRPVISADAESHFFARQSMAAAALLVLGEGDMVWRAIRESTDDRLAAHLLDRLLALEVEHRELLARLEDGESIQQQRGVILAIGELASQLNADERGVVREKLSKLYADAPSAAIHSAAEWSLRRIGAGDMVSKLRGLMATGSAVGERQWYITKPTSGELTMVMMAANEPFVMGSPISDPERYQGADGVRENRHRRVIGRRLAIAAHEVTVAQFKLFRADHEVEAQFSPSEDRPVNLVTWYEAAAYCNWLSEKEGIPPEQWCYPPGMIEEGMQMDEDYLQRTGYRLPTEAEWEFACRAGTTWSRHFGNGTHLLPHYAWYSAVSADGAMLPVGSLKPNPWGFFDMLGNSYEWCQGRPTSYPTDVPVVDDLADVEVLSNQDLRVLRGGAVFNNAANIRSSNRSVARPDFKDSANGFRPVRTLP